MEETRIPKRSEVDAAHTWNLGDLFPSDEAWERAYEALGTAAAEVAAYQGRLTESPQTLLAMFRVTDELDRKHSALFTYASCSADQDTGNNFYQNMRGKAMNRYVAYAGASAFITPEIMAADEQLLARFFEEEPALEQYRRNIYLIRRNAEHILTPAEERLLSAAAAVTAGPSDIAGAFIDADLHFPDAADADGGMHQLTNGSLVPLLTGADRVLRKNAFETYYARLGEYRNTVAAALDSQFKGLKFYADARKYPGTLAASLFPNEIPAEVYGNLIEAVHQNLEPMYRYVDLRRRMLGVEELHMYDVYTPIVADAQATISFEEARQTVLEALAVLGEDYTELLQEGFENRWIDVYENEGKRGGAYSSGSGDPHPYVLLNHKDDLKSMFTLAHEMGHALHSCLSARHQPRNTSDYVLFVAEVASTCNEVLLMRYLLNRTQDKKQRAYLINYFLDSFKGTIYRQTMFAEFEKFMGELCERGETLTADALTEEYLRLNRLYFGPGMISDPAIGLEWARIPHFFYNYYVYQYATGFSAAVALANRILTEGAPAVADYKRFLSGGSSTDPISLLKIAGVDMSTSAPITSALKLFGDLVTEMEQLL